MPSVRPHHKLRTRIAQASMCNEHVEHFEKVKVLPAKGKKAACTTCHHPFLRRYRPVERTSYSATVKATCGGKKAGKRCSRSNLQLTPFLSYLSPLSDPHPATEQQTKSHITPQMSRVCLLDEIGIHGTGQQNKASQDRTKRNHTIKRGRTLKKKSMTPTLGRSRP